MRGGEEECVGCAEGDDEIGGLRVEGCEGGRVVAGEDCYGDVCSHNAHNSGQYYLK